MNKEKDNLSKDLEGIFKKTIEINKHYVKQSTDIFKDFGNSDKELKNFKLFKPEVLMGAFTSFTKMNLDHYKNMMDLGFALTKKAFDSEAEDSNAGGEEGMEEPSFILSATALAGQNIKLQFLLENIKKEEASCQFVNSEYVNENEPFNALNLTTNFKPQSFQLAPGASETVEILIATNNDLSIGTYQSKVQVLGFEPSYFLIRITIAEKSKEQPISKTKKTTGNGRQTKRRTKKE